MNCRMIGMLSGGKWDRIIEKNRRVYDPVALSPTLTTNGGGNQEIKIMQNDERVRKLTPKECWRLMGFSDEDFEKASTQCSNSQLYKQAGNSIVVDVLMAIFKEML